VGNPQSVSDPLSFKKHFKQFGGDRSEAQHRRRYEKYLKSKAATPDVPAEVADLTSDIVIPPKDGDGRYVQHKAFRQLIKGEELPEVVEQLTRPVYQMSGRSLLGTSGSNLSQSLMESQTRYKRHPPPPPKEDTDDAT